MSSSNPTSPKLQKLPSIKRLPEYLHQLKAMRSDDFKVVSTTMLAKRLQVEPIVVRKDLEITGASGSPGIGYDLEALIGKIEEYLGWESPSPVFLVGAGALGTALMGYRGFEDYALKIVAAFDCAAAKIGTTVHGRKIYGMERFAELARKHRVETAILCVPGSEAQATAQVMADAGIRAIWNFTNTPLALPPGIILQRVNLAGDLAVLSVRLRHEKKNNNLN